MKILLQLIIEQYYTIIIVVYLLLNDSIDNDPIIPQCV